jgi:protein-serine/threonine kinase
MAAPIQQTALQQQQQQHQTAALYANQQADVQNRLAHLQLQHPQQLQRQGGRPPSPTRHAPFAPSSQPYLSNSSRAIVSRNTAGFSRNTIDRAEATRVKLEHLYKVSVEQAVERNSRYSFLGSLMM